MAYTIQYVNNNFMKLAKQLEDGVLSSVEICEQAGGATVAKLVKFSVYDAKDDGSDVLEKESILIAAGHPYSGLPGQYVLSKMVNDAAAVADATRKASLTVVEGAGSVTYTAKRGGPAGNSITITYVAGGSLDVTVLGTAITVQYVDDTSTVAQVAAAVTADAEASLLVTAVAGGTTTTAVTTNSGPTALTGGAVQPSGFAKFKSVGFYNKSTFIKGLNGTPSTTPRVVLVSKTHADQINI